MKINEDAHLFDESGISRKSYWTVSTGVAHGLGGANFDLPANIGNTVLPSHQSRVVLS